MKLTLGPIAPPIDAPVRIYLESKGTDFLVKATNGLVTANLFNFCTDGRVAKCSDSKDALKALGFKTQGNDVYTY